MSETSLLDKKWLPVKAVARKLGVSDKHIYALLSERKIPFVKVGKAYRIPLDELEEYLERRRSKAM